MVATPVAASTPARTSLTAPADGLEALPVTLAEGPITDRVRRFVEGELGWQVVAAADAGLPPAVALVEAAGAAEPGGAAVPRVLLVGPDDGPIEVGSACVRLRPDAVVRWPEDRTRLSAVVSSVLASVPRPQAVGQVVTVGGASGGVGTTTVALALTALHAWRGLRTLLVTDGPGHQGLEPSPPGVLRSSRLWVAARPVSGMSRARVISSPDARGVDGVDHPEVELTVLDRGVDADVDVLVARRDAAGLAAVVRTTASVVVLRDGPAPDGAVARAVGGRRTVALPDSVRVARSDLRGRGPTAYPGAWLRLLAPIARGPTG